MVDRQKPLSENEMEALRHIRNRIVHGGGAPSVRELTRLLGYRSPNAAAYILAGLIVRGYVRRGVSGKLQLLRDQEEVTHHARTVGIPLVGSVACGGPFLAEQNVEALVPVSTHLARPPHRYFLLRAQGDSMDEAGVSDGDLVLVRQQPTAETGERVVALVDDEATIKEFRIGKGGILLVPRSTNVKHHPIILTTDFQIQGVVVAALPDWKKG